MGQIRWVRSMANQLVQLGFASIIGKIGVPKNKLPLPAPTSNAARDAGNQGEKSHSSPASHRAEIDRDNRRAVFVCPYYGLVSAYYGRDILEMLRQTPDPISSRRVLPRLHRS